MNKRFFIFLALCFFGSASVFGQDTLPRFTVRNAGKNRIIISWVNPFPNISQISIQRGFDSLGTFKTILSVADAKSQQNGFTDTKATNDHMFYRLFYAMEGGSYNFSKSKRPDTSRVTLGASAPRPVMGPNGVPYNYKDSILVRAHDSIAIKPADSLVVKPKPPVIIKKPEWIPSHFVFSNPEGYVQLRFPEAPEKEYTVKFFEENNTPLFEIKNIKDKQLVLDKTNFYRSGWYYFELYLEEKLVERNKFYLRP
jgi:hypothetical protein